MKEEPRVTDPLVGQFIRLTREEYEAMPAWVLCELYRRFYGWMPLWKGSSFHVEFSLWIPA